MDPMFPARGLTRRPRSTAVRLLFQWVALAVSLFLAQSPASLPGPPPDVDHVEAASHGQSGHSATRHRASSRAAQAPLLKRLPAAPAAALCALSARSLPLAR